MRATRFERPTPVTRPTVLTLSLGDPELSGARPTGPAVVAFGFALELWDALRDSIGPLTGRASRAREGPVGKG